MNRKFRLRQFTEFKRVRRFGKSYAHPFVVLVVQPNAQGKIQIGVTAGRSVGSAVQRNRAKRMLRESVRPLTPSLVPGWNIILVARPSILNAHSMEIKSALKQLLVKAEVTSDTHEP